MANPTSFYTTGMSLFREPAHDPDSKERDLSLSEFIAYVRNGLWKQQVDAVRAARQAGDEPRFLRLKESLPGVTPAGSFTHARNDGWNGIGRHVGSRGR